MKKVIGLEKEHEIKIILFNKKYKGDEVKNKVMTFKENLQIDKNILPSFLNEYDNKKEKSEMARKEIQRFTKFNENFLERDELRVELNPSINTDLFLCEYKVKLNINFSNGASNNKEEFLIDIYTLRPTVIDKFLEPYFNIKEHGSFDAQYEGQNDYKDINKEKEEVIDSDFVNLEKKDYYLMLNDKKNNFKKSEKSLIDNFKY